MGVPSCGLKLAVAPSHSPEQKEARWTCDLFWHINEYETWLPLQVGPKPCASAPREQVGTEVGTYAALTSLYKLTSLASAWDHLIISLKSQVHMCASSFQVAFCAPMLCQSLLACGIYGKLIPCSAGLLLFISRFRSCCSGPAGWQWCTDSLVSTLVYNWWRSTTRCCKVLWYHGQLLISDMF